MNGTGDSLVITDAGTRYTVAVGAILDTASLSNRIDVNLLTMNVTGDSLVITDAGTRYAVAVGAILDTTSLSNRINRNLDSINLNEQAVIDSIASVRSELADTAADLRSLINDHITLDEDTDSTNELITALTIADDSLKITEGGNDFAVYVEDMDTTNERIDSMSFRNDTLTVYEPSNPQKVYIETFIKAAGKVNADGTTAKAFNATVERDNTGDYTITFDTDMADDNYIIQLSQPDRTGAGNDDPGITYYGQTVSGFSVNIGDNDNGSGDRVDYNSEFMFTVIDFDF